MTNQSPNNNRMKKFISALLIVASLGTVGVAFAEDGGSSTASGELHLNGGLNITPGIGSTNASAGVSADVKANFEQRAKERAGEEIDRRITALNKLVTRVDDKKRVSQDGKDNISATAQSQIQLLTTLKAKIESDDTTTLKDDVSTITKTYRIFALVIPQGAIKAAADRIDTTVDLMTAFGTKLNTRINDAKTAGKDVSALESAYTDFTAKLADAKVQAQAAVDETVNLQPDNGDQATMTANKTALMDARAKLQAARKDLQAARADAETIIKGLRALNPKATTDTSTSTSTSTTATTTP
jgi:hypothetical protein